VSKAKRLKGLEDENSRLKPMNVPQGPNQRWSLDFVSDAFSDTRRASNCRSDQVSLPPQSSSPARQMIISQYN
jgi:hypothetical protein